MKLRIQISKLTTGGEDLITDEILDIGDKFLSLYVEELCLLNINENSQFTTIPRKDRLNEK